MGQVVEMSNLVRSEELKKLVKEINQRRLRNGKKKLTTDRIARYLIKNKEQIVNEFITL